MKNAATYAICLCLIVAVTFSRTSAAGSDNLVRPDLIQSLGGSQKLDRSKMANEGLQEEESNPKFKVSEEDIARAKNNEQKKHSKLIVYTLVTLGIIVMVLIVSFGLWKGPLCCVFFTLCPCCLLAYPCLQLFLKKYNEPKKIMHSDLQKYIPGVFYNDDGLLKRYKPTGKEMDCFADVVKHIDRKEGKTAK